MNEYFKYTAPYRWFHSPKTFYENIESFFRWIKHSFQRAFRGYADCDTWGFDSYLSEVIANGLKHLKKYTHGYPGDFNSPEEWEAALQTMIDGFEAATNIINAEYIDECITGYEDHEMRLTNGSTIIEKHWPIIDFKKSKIMEKALMDKFEVGMKLFHKHYFGLWD